MTDPVSLFADPGLSSREAADRLQRDGPNQLSATRSRTVLSSALAIVREPMSLLLIGCGAIYLVLGDMQESLMLLGFVFFILAITLVQERKTERALEALRDLASPRALVIRDGVRRRIAGREVVRGDLVIISEGDRVPADGAVLAGPDLVTDESLLTGESVPVRKSEWDGQTPIARPGGDGLPFVYSGTLVVGGSAITRVLSTGASTEFGRVGKALQEVQARSTRLEQETKRLVTRLAWCGGGLSLLVIVVYGVLRSDWLGGLLAGLTLAMAVLPNEFPVVVTIFLALGAWRLSRVRVLARSLPALEALGSTTVLCVDKTGTLTENRMRVARLVGGGESFDVARLPTDPLPEAVHEVVEYSILASRRDPFDPMERAFKELGEEKLAGTEHLRPDWSLRREYPLSRELLAVTQVWAAPGETAMVVASKGAPEAIAQLCAFDPERSERLAKAVGALAGEGLRVLAVARSRFTGAALPDDVRCFSFEFVGLVGLADPVRHDVPAAVKECRTAGIQVAMITGDYPATAEAIARQIGLDVEAGVLCGHEIDRMSGDELRRRVRVARVFARVLPEQKLRLVQAFQGIGEIVAMTGDGVNDAPALKAADIGIAMGARGTDVAREAAALVLLEDDFCSLVQAVRTGRRVIENLEKALAFVLAVHLPIVGLTVIPIVMGWPLVLMPIHIAFLHLIIDPACSVVFEAEPEEPEIMQRPPRDPKAPLFGRRVLALSGLQGAVVLGVVLGVYAFALSHAEPEPHARALTFATLIIADLSLIFTNRSWSRTIAGSLSTPNRWLWWVTFATVGFLTIAIYAPPVARLFSFSALHATDVAAATAAGALSIGWFEVLKKFLREKALCAPIRAGDQRSLKPG